MKQNLNMRSAMSDAAYRLLLPILVILNLIIHKIILSIGIITKSTKGFIISKSWRKETVNRLHEDINMKFANNKFESEQISLSFFDECYICEHNSKFLSLLNNSTTTTSTTQKPLLIMLVGIPGSGKSTLARALSSSNINYTPDIAERRVKWKVCNQDALGSRKNVLIHARRALEQKDSVIIDRCNIDRKQRKHWISLAEQHNVQALCVIVSDCLDVDKCAERAYQRGDDGVHDADTDWKRVCNICRSEFERPDLSEGLAGIYCCDGKESVDKLLIALGHSS